MQYHKVSHDDEISTAAYNGSAPAVTQTFNGHCEPSQSHHGAWPATKVAPHHGACHWGGATVVAGKTVTVWQPWSSDSHRCLITHLLLWYILYFWKGANLIWIWVFNLKLGTQANAWRDLSNVFFFVGCGPATDTRTILNWHYYVLRMVVMQCVIRKIPVS